MITVEIVVEAVLLTIITIVIKMKQKDEVERYYYTVIWIEFLAYANTYRWHAFMIFAREIDPDPNYTLQHFKHRNIVFRVFRCEKLFHSRVFYR